MGSVKVANTNLLDLSALLDYMEVDSNLDGKVTYSEVSTYFKGQLDRLIIERDYLDEQHRQLEGKLKRVAQKFTYLQKKFSAFNDTNRDGYVSFDEFKAALAKIPVVVELE
ncbi:MULTISPECIES: EF-hand domain-containing protein [unclassified Pseudomonas]|uniref:EF-hand domain-containing protein n=1 Tax=unclassified Pseudomonas TaxID=196821 RepID=UPI000A1FC7FE|nr:MULTISPECIES: EF-hand domain-containing protein [unclassified Pseudomonas]